MLQDDKSYWPKKVVLIVLAFNTTQNMQNWIQTIPDQCSYPPGLHVDIIHFTARRSHGEVNRNILSIILISQ